jgi:hypothetical protein
MSNDDVLQCPLCHGHSHVTRADLIELLTDRNLRQKIELYLAELLLAEPIPAGAIRPEPRDFQQDAHTWNPQLPIWRRSPKE